VDCKRGCKGHMGREGPRGGLQRVVYF